MSALRQQTPPDFAAPDGAMPAPEQADRAPTPAERAGAAPPVRSAPEDLLDAVDISADRLSALHGVFDQLGTHATEALRKVAPSPIFFLLSELVSRRIGDVFEGLQGQHVAASFFAPDWNARVLIAADAAFVHSALEALFGADGSVELNAEGRPFSKLELRVAGSMFEHVGRALRAALSPGAEMPLRLEKIDTVLSPTVIGRKRDLAVVARFGIWTLERGGEMIVALPRAALTQVTANRRRFARAPHDPAWSLQMQREMRRTEVTLEAVLAETELALGDIAALRPGQVLALNATARSPVRVHCDGQPLFRCELGQAQGSYTLRVRDISDEEQEAMDELAAR